MARLFPALMLGLSLGASADVSNPPASDELILASLQGNRGVVVALQARTGRRLWDMSLPGLTYLGMLDSSVLVDRRGRFFCGVSGQGKVCLVSGRTGEKTWEVDFSQARYPTLIDSDDERLYVSEFLGGGTAALDPATGRQLWRADNGGIVRICSGLLVAFSFQQNRLAVLKPSDGTELWNLTVGGLYLGSDNSSCFVSANATQETLCLDLATGKKRWAMARVCQAAVFGGSSIYLTDTAGSVFAADAATGKILWTFDASREQRHLVLASGALFALSRQSHDGRCLDPATGRELYAFEGTVYNPHMASQFVICGSRALYCRQRDRKIFRVEAKTGRVDWEFEMPQPAMGLVATADSVVAVSMRGIVGLNARTGAKRWEDKTLRTQFFWARLLRG